MTITTSRHPISGWCHKAVETSTTSGPIPTSAIAGLTLSSASGTGNIEQTSSTWEDVKAGIAIWQSWSEGSSNPSTSKHGIVYGATAVRLVAASGQSTLGVRI